MPRLLQINVTANFASTGRIAEDIGNVAIANGWESFIAYGREHNPSNSHLLKIGGKLSIYTHVLISRLLDRHGFGSYFATKKFLKQVDLIHPDIIQLHNVHGYFLNLPLVLKYCADKQIPLVWSLHDCWSMTGHCAHFALEGCQKWKTGCNKCPLLKDYPRSFGIIDSSKKNYSQKRDLIKAVRVLKLISVSQWIADIAAQSYLKCHSITVIPNGIDTEVFRPRNNGPELKKKLGLDGKFVIMGSGTNWNDYKGLDDFAKLRARLPEDYAIIIVGMSQEDIRNKLPKGLIGIPRTKTPQELSEYYSMADCVMSLSRMESFGLTPIEGFACGTPAIVYDNTALPELVSNGTGFVVTPGDIDELVEKVNKMKELGKHSFTEECRKTAMKKYNRDDCYGRYMELYNALI